MRKVDNMRIAIVDDEEKWRKAVYKEVKSYFKNTEIKGHFYQSGESFLEKNLQYDIVFMDIEMPGMDGFDTAAQYKLFYPESIIIILTTHTDLSRKGYLVNAFRYIDKINMKEELNEALLSVEKLMNRNQKVSINLVNFGKRELSVKDIIYFETDGRNVKSHTVFDRFICNDNIGELEKQLENMGFFRTHKSFLVNLDFIKSISGITKNSVKLKNGDEVFLSSRKYYELRKKYTERIFEYANS